MLIKMSLYKSLTIDKEKDFFLLDCNPFHSSDIIPIASFFMTSFITEKVKVLRDFFRLTIFFYPLRYISSQWKGSSSRGWFIEILSTWMNTEDDLCPNGCIYPKNRVVKIKISLPLKGIVEIMGAQQFIIKNCYFVTFSGSMISFQTFLFRFFASFCSVCTYCRFLNVNNECHNTIYHNAKQKLFSFLALAWKVTVEC